MKIFIAATIIFIACLILDVIYDQQLWDFNTRITKYMQQKQTPGLQSMFNFFSNWINIFPGIALLIFIFTENKLASIIYMCLIQFTISFNSVLKNVYHQPRPYWIEPDIVALSCNKEFGKPSGHAMGSLLMCFLLPLMVLPSTFVKKPKLIKSIILCFVSIWTVMTALSRIYLGMHTIGQILLGWMYSSYFILIYLSYLHQPIMEYLKTRLSSIDLTWKFVFMVGLSTLGWLGISFLFYFLDRKNLYLNQAKLTQWTQNIYKKCPNQTELLSIHSSQVFQSFCLNKSFEITFIFFIFLGIKLSHGKNNEEEFTQNYSKLNWKQKCFRFLLLIIPLSTVKFLDFINSDNVWVMIFSYKDYPLECLMWTYPYIWICKTIKIFQFKY
ncbi:unnamed protein product (macronuclear) [Paramecium tetraurelia]|uniref:Phosphatidic acid phosphatase type 2/haloperoxidase domain-containing protein n=1 Tax=Paramecium tetraurelia TaxID=5888 RepID=A0BQB5_PARTE|nr:uncharacterized protein GSPATT00030961001 [Paramecium tetraurelia]CAK60732.1 unnamed protein product [Paramecium tetraurelia]|eukprot:XP_001428130.1 hypothetical protein (macronuclear) [Paramecium tetraurelia strain d4-2]